jgi:hypothetical protein
MKGIRGSVCGGGGVARSVAEHHVLYGSRTVAVRPQQDNRCIRGYEYRTEPVYRNYLFP